jgi:hypothetical protein
MSFKSPIMILEVKIESVLIHLIKMILDYILTEVGWMNFFEGLNRFFEHSERFESTDGVICFALTLIYLLVCLSGVMVSILLLVIRPRVWEFFRH